MAQNLIQAAGGAAQKPTRFVSLFTSRFLTGLYTNRSLLRGPLQSLYSEFYHLGATDALCDGLNSELSIRQTMTRRPGNPKYCTAQTAAAIDDFYSFHKSDGTISVIADSATDVEIVTPTAITSIFTKTSGAGQGYFQGINKTLYISDGIDLVKYIPGTTNPITQTSIWNLGGAAPTTAPALVVTQTASTSIPWQAVSTYSTMGLLTDSNGNIQQLVSVNASGTNTTQYGTTGNGEPAWNQTPGGTTTDGTITWTNFGPVTLWAANQVYENFSVGGTLTTPSTIYDPTSSTFQSNTNPSLADGTSGSTKPHFNGVEGGITWDPPSGGHPPGVKWICAVPNNPGVSGDGFIGKWAPSTSFALNAKIVQAYILPPPPNQTIFIHASSGGTSGAGGSAPIWSTITGGQTVDNDLVWVCQGSATRQINTTYVAWVAGQLTFGVIKDSNGNFQVCTTSGTTSSTATASVSWQTIYGSKTLDGTVVWTCVGTSLSWALNTIWYLPAIGFAPPTAAQPYGSASITDNSNTRINQFVIISGKSKTGLQPTWNGIGATTTDGTITWIGVSAFLSVGTSWTKNRGYCYSFKARTTTDLSVTEAPPLQLPNTNSPNLVGPLGAPTGCGDGSVSTASPVTQLTGANSGAQVKISGLGSTDPQYDTIIIFRSADGFSASGPYLYLTEIAMPPVVGGLPGTWSVIDFMPDAATNLLPGLDPLITAPIDLVNDPPPGQLGSTNFSPSASNPLVPTAGSALIGLTYHQGRLWGYIGNNVWASGGPDTNPGNGFTAWPPAQVFPFNSNVTKLVPTATALLVFTTTDVFLIGGGPAITDYYSQLLAPGVGLLSWNALTMMLGLPYMFSSDRQFITIDPSGGFTRIGHPIGDKLSQYDPSQVYVTYHSYGDQEHALFISNGSSEWYRCDPNPTPDSQLTGPVWSPRATIAGGFKAMSSIEVSPGTRKLLIGPPSVGYILGRDSTFTSFLDNTSPYSSYFTMGNIVLAHPGQMAECDFIEADFMQVGTQPTISILFDELSASNGAAFESISNSFVSDPPKMFGETATPKTLWMNRYYFGQTTPGNINNEPLPAWCKSMQIKVDFGNTNTIQNELLAFTIFGALFQER
jgi:hypothetical protein